MLNHFMPETNKKIKEAVIANKSRKTSSRKD